MSRLDDAMRSLRDDVDGASPDASATLSRVLLASKRERRVGRMRLLSLLAAALLLVGALAWAQHRAWFASTAPPVPPSVAVPGAPPVPPSFPEAPPPAPRQPEEIRVPENASAASKPTAVVGVASASGSAASRPAASAAGTGDPGSVELAAYESAHRAHFDGHDAGAALELWDAYLRRFPRGRWVPEARYNRALCLLRLHRDAEARPTLEAFARGDYGAYRQVEARRLLVAIDAGP